MAAFQRAQGWRGGDADGIAGPETLRRLGVSATKTASTSYSKATKSTTKKKKVTTTSKATSKQTAGLSKAKTKKLQRKLIKRGYRIPSGPTGWYGPETTRAVKAFQRAQGWRGSGADGIAGAETLRRLGVTKAKTTSSTKKKTTKKKTAKRTSTTASSGASGRTTWNAKDAHLVYDLQGALIAKGYSIPAGQTGYFGPRTKQAVKAFQRAQGWRGSQADGIPGSQTLKRLGL